MSLRAVMEAVAAEAPAVSVTPAVDGSVAWEVAGVVVATLDPTGSTASFRLDPVLADAARRTPDVMAAGQGPSWVAFRPAALDEHAVDRAQAWFAAAVRRAGPGSG